MLGKREAATVTQEGKSLKKHIEGVLFRPAVLHPDERGELCEIYNPAWAIHPEPLRYIYMATVWPGKVKGWIYHELQDDRIFGAVGYMKWVLYDLREDSPTRGMINEFHLTERNRGLLIVPKFVAHAVQNIGTCDAMFVNTPTRPYNYAAPDKIRIPFDSPDIPYSFDRGPGW